MADRARPPKASRERDTGACSSGRPRTIGVAPLHSWRWMQVVIWLPSSSWASSWLARCQCARTLLTVI